MSEQHTEPSIFRNWTERARAAMTAAEEEANRLNHNYLGTEHLLLGLLAVREGIGAKVLEELGILSDDVRKAVEQTVGRGAQAHCGPRPLTPRLKKVLELARGAARSFGHGYIGTEHLLLGLVEEGQGVAAGALEGLGATLDSVRAQIQEILGAPLRSRVAAILKKENVLSYRVNSRDLGAIDLLIESGICTTRSDAAAWLIHAGIEANQALFERLNNTVAEIRRLRQEAQAIAHDLGSRAPKPGAGATGTGGEETKPPTETS